ncbi:HlyD family efflux transporter periplasmic adaptor subunit [Chamaesiphon minutus]|uniref:ABC exporter membrane fusion protein, DevB family n=1 Tax=Chamaesiphon minutus (strain ATCC 27169 / PCC 6605) TaxID=1173020 RepID=K9UDX4_CHAP6|nr:HlyD family efflux transporter periplasmic adaptor subunit [Chamaesiphon minutus]AFY92636.1 ABC exporter membrane fusion protein, DevB family [Chamaesiphon minutus PCC 6605]
MFDKLERQTKLNVSGKQTPLMWWGTIALIAISGGGIHLRQQQAAQQAAESKAQSIVVATKAVPITVTALGKLAPKGEVIKLSAPTSNEGVKIDKLLVEEGTTVKSGQLVAILDSQRRLQAAVDEAKATVNVARANLEKVKAGAKQGEINAQKATIAKLQAEQGTGIEAQKATLARVVAETATQSEAYKATIAKIVAETATQIEAQTGAIAEAQAGLANARSEDKRYATLYQQGAVSASNGDSKRLTLLTAQQKVNQALANLKRIESSGKQQLAEAQANLRRIETSGQHQIDEARANLRKLETSTQQQVKESQFTLAKIAEIRPVDVLSAETEIDSAIASLKRAEANLAQAYIKSPQDGQILEIFARPGEVVGTNGIADLGKTSQMYGVVEVYQNDINKVRIGQKVNITSNSLPSKLQGTIERVGVQVKRQNTINADPSSNIDDRVVEVHAILDSKSSQLAAKFTNLQIQATIDLK